MKPLLVLSLLCTCLVSAENNAEKQDGKSKPPQLNTIQQSPKYETIYQPIKYQPQQQQQPKYVPIQIIPKPYYIPATPGQPHAMIIIAQPALLPQSVVYGNPTQQLLNYFHNNPQAKYQLLHGNYQQPALQQVVASPSVGNYILAPAPQYPTPVQYQPQPVQYQTQYLQTNQLQPVAQYPTQQEEVYTNQQQTAPALHYSGGQQQHQQQQPRLTSLAQIAQLAAQQYSTSQAKSAPAIVTGFENFTPEQQAQIKQQLNAHLGTNYHALTASAQEPASLQYSSKYNAENEMSEFVPSPQVGKSEESATTTSSSNIMKARARYNKG